MPCSLNTSLQFLIAMGSTGQRDYVDSTRPLKVLIIGCGLGGLSCAISCLKEGLEVEMLEKAKEIGEVGAGIQVPPNATRVLAHYDLINEFEAAGADLCMERHALSYKDGSLIFPGGTPELNKREFGHYWYVIHRVDYHRVLLDEARRRGAKIHLDCDVVEVNTTVPSVKLSSGEMHSADAVIGADGLRSFVRDTVLGYHVDPEPTGDMAFRMTVSRDVIDHLDDPYWNEVKTAGIAKNWWGPDSHVIFYPLRSKTVYNLVLLRPDDLPPGVMTETADIAQMKTCVEDWDPNIKKIMSTVESCLKWKICHMSELEKWTRDSVALLGDACHPTLPYQAQGAAMAVEDGAALGVLLGQLSRSGRTGRKAYVPEILGVYEVMRKKRTTLNVQGAIENRDLFQMADPERVEKRKEQLRKADLNDINNDCPWGYANLKYQKQLMGFDTIADAREQYRKWSESVR